MFAADSELRKGNYAFKNECISYELEDKTLGLVGLGRIGLDVAVKCKLGFRMNVIAYDPYAQKEIAEEHGIKLVDTLGEVLEQSDFVSLHLPLTERTKEIIGINEFKKMKKTAFLINCARGAVVDENALIDALNNNKIGGAGLDVFTQEPPETGNSLLQMSNVVVTPHNSSLTVDGKIKMAVYAVEQLLKVLRGDKADFVVNKEVLG